MGPTIPGRTWEALRTLVRLWPLVYTSSFRRIIPLSVLLEVLLSGHLDAATLKGPTRVKLPQLPDQVQCAYEFDAATLKMQEAQLTRTQDGIYATVESGFGAVLLPLPDCPPLIQPGKLPSTAARQASLR